MIYRILLALALAFSPLAFSPIAAQAEISVAPREGRSALGLNLSEVIAWSTEMPFIDQMHSATEWLGHLSGQWGGIEADEMQAQGLLDEDGWVLQTPRNASKVTTSILVDLPPEMTSVNGVWHVSWEGSAHLGFWGGARNVRYGDNSATFEYNVADGSVFIEFRRGSVRNLSIVHERHLEAHAAGQIFNPDWLARIGSVEQMRFMDWMLTNNSTVTSWEDRARVGDYTWARRGVPLETIIALANQTGAEPWVNIPHLADDTYVREFARVMHDGLNPELRAWFEYSNEVWNWSFQQAQWAEETAQARWNREWAWVQYGAVRAAEIMRIIDEVYAGETHRRVRVLGLFTAYLGLEQDMLNAPDYMAENPAHRPPREVFDVLAVTGYFSGELHNEEKRDLISQWLTESRAVAGANADAQGLSGAAREAFITDHRFDHAIELAAQELRDGSVSGRDDQHDVQDLLDGALAYHARLAREHDMALVMYEGGTHVVANPADHQNEELLEFFLQLNHSPQMGDLYRQLIAGWFELTDAPFMAYTDIGKATRWGSWGALRHIDDENPRWTALIEATAR